MMRVLHSIQCDECGGYGSKTVFVCHAYLCKRCVLAILELMEDTKCADPNTRSLQE